MNDGSVVLFPHPGTEHASAKRGDIFPWNRKGHRRKYLVTQARLANRSTSQSWCLEDRTQPVAMWTEFEPPTHIHLFEETWAPGLPEAWHEPLPVGPPPAFAQNTDPWIFGSSFRYAICKQESVPYLASLPGN